MFDRFDILRLSLLPGIGPTRGRALVNAFASFGEIRRAGAAALTRVDGIDRTLAARLRKAFRDEELTGEMERRIDHARKMIGKLGLRFVTCFEPEYPQCLHHIYDPPLYLFMRGALEEKDARGIAVVGTRAASGYGKEAAERFAADLAACGITITSGLALGIDTVAHQTALREGGRTVAVLGSGADVIYPAQNRKLAEQVATSGCVLSELPPGAKPDAPNFPRRNRIISALSQGVLIVESAEHGGAMITAQLALDQGKSVFALPGPIFSRQSRGPNLLIKNGMAKLAQSIEDILEDIPSLTPRKKPAPVVQLSLFEQEILGEIGDAAVHIDELADATGRSTADLLVQLLRMEFAGLVRQLPGKLFMRAEA